MKGISIGTIARITGAQLIASGDVEAVYHSEITHITQDSREATTGSLFFAIKGEKVDGHSFIPACFAQGAGACLSEELYSPPEGAALLLVTDVKRALLRIAGYYRKQFNIPILAITGSVGKTTTKDMIASVLSQKFNTLWTEGNYNNEIGVPLTLFRLEEEHQMAVIEMGMNHFGEIHTLAEVVRPDMGLISNVGVAHIEYLGSREGILQAKCELFDFMDPRGTVILNADNDMLLTLDGKLPQNIRWFGIKNQRDIYADQITPVGLEATRCIVHTGKGSFDVTIPIPGVHMIENALSAVAVGLEMGIGLKKIKAGIESFVPTKNRMNVMKVGNDITILNDVYNANPVSTKASLDILASAVGRKIAILGFMGELGEFAQQMHKEVGAYAGEKKIDLLFCIGGFSEEMAEGAKEGGVEAFSFATQEDFWQGGLPQITEGDTILIKGSRSMALEKTVEKIQGVN